MKFYIYSILGDECKNEDFEVEQLLVFFFSMVDEIDKCVTLCTLNVDDLIIIIIIISISSSNSVHQSA